MSDTPQILCAIDFSGLSIRGADVAAALAKALGLPLRLVHVASEWPIAPDAVPLVDQMEVWREQLAAEVKRLSDTGVEVTSDLRYGVASRELVAAAIERPTKLIVIGSIGHGMADRWLLGSVAERVAESAPVPVLVVRDPAPLLAWLKSGQPLRLLCGVDFTLSSEAALVAIKEWDRIGLLEVEAVHLREERHSRVTSLVGGASRPEEATPSIDVELGRDVWDRVSRILGQPPVKAHVSCTGRHPDHELARLAEAREAGLVVVGTHQRHGWQRLTAPSFSRGVLAHASTNVMCVPVGPYVPAFEAPVFRRALVATDFSTMGHDDLRYAFGLVTAGGEIHVLHVVPAPEPAMNPMVRSMSYLASSIESERARAAAQTKLDDLLRAIPPAANIRVTTKTIAHENVSQAICETAEEFGADVICMGSGGGPRAVGAVLGSVVHAVIARSQRPVLVVPPTPV